MKKHALIIGSAGQDGTLLNQLLRQHEYEVTGLRQSDLDILDSAKVFAFLAGLKPDEVYYLAAYHHSSEDLPPSSGEMFHRSMNVHFHGLINFLDAIVGASAASKLFYASSSHVFGAFDDGLQNEQSAYAPQSEYAITKVAGMHACAHYRRVHRVFACVGILYNHESPLRKPVFLSKKIAMAAARIVRAGSGTLELGDLQAQVDWGAAVDYVDAMHRMLQVDRPADYVVASGQLHTVREFVEIAFRYVGLNYESHITSKSISALRNNGRRIGDSSKLRKVTGWSPAFSFEQMVHMLVQFELDSLDTNAPAIR